MMRSVGHVDALGETAYSVNWSTTVTMNEPMLAATEDAKLDIHLSYHLVND
jgi:hypothetical protein